MIALPLLCVSFLTQRVYAEGTKDMDNGDEGYRPYTERNKLKTFGQQRLSHMQVYLKSGETVYFGTSVDNGTLYDDATDSTYFFTNAEMGTSFNDSELKYLNSADIWVYKGTDAELSDASLPYSGNARNNDSFLIDIASDATNTTPGYIYNGEQEDGGVDLDGTGTGYKVTSDNTLETVGSVAEGTKTNANTFTAPSDGVYSVVFFSANMSAENPTMMKLSDKTTPFAKTQKGSTIASWDISVYNNGALQTGRVFTKTLFMNIGGNAFKKQAGTGALYSDIYAVTDDGYQYKVDFNGMDPYGFVFFANSRGMLTKDSDGNTSSLYHGARSDNNLLSDFVKNNIILNADSTTAEDKTYNMFYEKPSADTLKNALGISDPSSGVGDISDFKFAGTGDSTANEGYVGEGGKFSFKASDDISATSYELRLNFGDNNTVTLSNDLKKGTTNTISWDGKDANGKVVGAGTYSTVNASIVLKGGEVHFPLLDVEQNLNGVKITRLNGRNPNDATVYFNNSASNAGETTGDWTVEKNWTAGSEADATTGVDSSDGAMKFTDTNTKNDQKKLRTSNGGTLQVLGDGDQCALDLWADYNRSVSLNNWSFTLKDTSFTVTKVWDNTNRIDNAGKASNTNPASVTMTLQESSNGGKTWSKANETATGETLINPVTYDTTTSNKYTWTGLDPAKTYQVKETSIRGYDTTYGTVSGSAAKGYQQTVTNKYHPTSLTLKKIWNMNGFTGTHPASVTFEVYGLSKPNAKFSPSENDKPLYTETLTVDGSNTWTDQTLKIDNIDSTLYYYVFETAVNGYSVFGEGQASGNIANGFYSTITNIYNSDASKTVAAVKVWTDADLDPMYRPSSILMTLYNKKTGEKVTKDFAGNDISNPVTLNDMNGWYYIWPGLLSSDDTADNYYVEETLADGTALKGYAAAEDKLFEPHFGFIGLDNTYQYTTYTVTKAWNNNGGSGNPSSATVHLQESIDGGKTFFDYSGEDAAAVLDQKGNWSYKWTNLPSYTYTNGSAVPVVYQTYEDQVDDYTTNYGAVSGSAENGYTQTVTNTSVYTTLHVQKKWDHGTQNEEDWPNAVSISLLADGKEVYSGVLYDGNDWAGTFYDMPIYNEDGSVIKYTVDELDVNGYKKSNDGISGNSSEGYEVTFLNTYNEPTPSPTPTPTPTPDDSTKYAAPDTGDATNAWQWGLLFGGMVVVIGIVLYVKKKNTK
jgi:hypothetical protein